MTSFGIKYSTVPWEDLFTCFPQCWQQSGMMAVLRNSCSNLFFIEDMFLCAKNALPEHEVWSQRTSLFDGGVCMAQRENTIESVSGELPQRSGGEIGDLTHRLDGTLEEDHSKTQLLSTVAQDLV